MRAIYDFAALLGRLSLAAIFLGSLVEKLSNWQGTIEFMEAATTMEEIASPGSFWLPGAVALLLLGGASLVVGFWTRLGAVLLMLFLVTATYFFHAFWNLDPATDEYSAQQMKFVQNLAVLGGLLTVFAHGPGRLSLDAKRSGSGGGDE